MGDLGLDTTLSPLDGARADGVVRFGVDLSDDWRIWTLNGGYVAAVALRAAGAVTSFDRPASMSLQLLSGAVAPTEGGGVAFWAHVGGFLGGLLLTPLFRDPDLLAAHRSVHGLR